MVFVIPYNSNVDFKDIFYVCINPLKILNENELRYFNIKPERRN